MRPETIRRLIVFGVCVLGVGSLYLMPSMSGTPNPSGYPRPGDRPDGSPSRSIDQPPQAAATGEVPTTGTELPSQSPPRPQIGRATATSLPPRPSPAERSPAGQTAFDPNDERDREPPTRVAAIDPAEVTSEGLGLTWPAATDNNRVIGYRILLNGYEVATTAETRATVQWFNDDTGQHVVQIKAIDAAGNQSTSSPTLVVVRPSTEPSQTPTPTPEPTPTPTESATPTPGPSPSPSSEATEQGPEGTDGPQ